jgi:hypothetical protein
MTALMIKDSVPSRYGVGLNHDCWTGPESITVEADDAKCMSDMNLLLFTPSRMMPTWAFEPSNYWYALSPTYVIAAFEGLCPNIRVGTVVEDITHPEWFSLAHVTKGPLNLIELGRIVDGLTRDLYAKNFRSVDNALDSADPSQMSNDAIVAIARVTYSARDVLVSWPTFVRRSKETLSHRGLSEKMMAGL